MKLNHVNFPDGSKLIPISNGLYDYFSEREGWEGWSRIRWIKEKMLIVGGDRASNNNRSKMQQVFDHLNKIHTRH